MGELTIKKTGNTGRTGDGVVFESIGLRDPFMACGGSPKMRNAAEQRVMQTHALKTVS